MKKISRKSVPMVLALLIALIIFSGCGQTPSEGNAANDVISGDGAGSRADKESENGNNGDGGEEAENPASSEEEENNEGGGAGEENLAVSTDGITGDAFQNADNRQGRTEETASAQELTVRFGDEGDPFTMHLYDNATAQAIARHVGTADWRLPIYHYDDYENWEVMQYYDIPSRYEIPSNPEAVTSERAGAVYYSEPNRIVLFFQDAEVTGEYTPVGYFEYSEEFVNAVEQNPVLEGWGNKVVNIASD